MNINGQQTDNCVETVGLTHKFSGSETALKAVDLRVASGSIYGFLGPNGAGKTTTLKLILGLLKKQQGDIRVFGRSPATDRVAILRRIGAMIESPSIYGHLTAAENVEVFRKIYGCSKGRIREVLGLVGLERTGAKRAAQFSLGMKQRLGIAIALLPSPDLLILDEPTNGLDPNGILEIRELLRGLNQDHGITILISSHLLPEIEKLVTHVGVINGGRILFQGTLADLMSKRRQNSFTVIETSDAAEASRIASSSFGFDALVDSNKVSIPLLGGEQVARLNRRLVESGVDVYKIGKIESDLEGVFFELLET